MADGLAACFSCEIIVIGACRRRMPCNAQQGIYRRHELSEKSPSSPTRDLLTTKYFSSILALPYSYIGQSVEATGLNRLKSGRQDANSLKQNALREAGQDARSMETPLPPIARQRLSLGDVIGVFVRTAVR